MLKLKRLSFVKIIKYTAAIILILTAIILSSCSDTITGGALLHFLGIDTGDYLNETVTATYDSDSELAAELTEITRVLSIDSPYLTSFIDFKTALTSYRDSVLNYMLGGNYSKYTGNINLLDEASHAYPQMQISTVIPAKEFEYTFYKYFGGSKKVNNESGVRFSYLPKIDAYTSVAQPQLNETAVNFISLEETENTYRLCFYNTLDDKISPDYMAVFIKREGDTAYLRSLTESERTVNAE